MLILGSGSPRRLELLGQLGLTPDAVRPPDVNEDPLPAELPRPYCNRITGAKLDAISANTDDVVLCADTTVALGRRILGKPADKSEAEAFLKLLSGRRHKVITAIGVKRGDQRWQTDVVSTVRMKQISDQERDQYIASNDWQGKAGGYSIQSQASAMIPWIQGSYSAIMGLPLAETANLLRAAGLPVTLAGGS